MDAFEQLLAEILWQQGLWVRTSVKVELTKEEKKAIGRISAPRWELDIVAYSGRDNFIRVVECKSYLDSVGVQATGFDSSTPDSTRYKLFNDSKLREVVFGRLKQQFYDVGVCARDPTIKLTLACGKVRERDREWIAQHFKENDWDFWDEAWLRRRLGEIANTGYENQVSAVVAKLLLRGEVSSSTPERGIIGDPP